MWVWFNQLQGFNSGVALQVSLKKLHLWTPHAWQFQPALPHGCPQPFRHHTQPHNQETESSSLYFLTAAPWLSDVIPSLHYHVNQFFAINAICYLLLVEPWLTKWLLHLKDLASKTVLLFLSQFCTNPLTKIEILEKKKIFPVLHFGTSITPRFWRNW